jgi:hypothetical protein
LDCSSEYLNRVGEKKVKVGDLVRMNNVSLTSDKGWLSGEGDNNKITGVVVGVTYGPNSDEDDYWIKVVFLDGTRSTLFHDEVEILKIVEK